MSLRTTYWEQLSCSNIGICNQPNDTSHMILESQNQWLELLCNYIVVKLHHSCLKISINLSNSACPTFVLKVCSAIHLALGSVANLTLTRRVPLSFRSLPRISTVFVTVAYEHNITNVVNSLLRNRIFKHEHTSIAGTASEVSYKQQKIHVTFKF